eukprot:5209427-Pyramimonas_sp.AAC.1
MMGVRQSVGGTQLFIMVAIGWLETGFGVHTNRNEDDVRAYKSERHMRDISARMCMQRGSRSPHVSMVRTGVWGGRRTGVQGDHAQELTPQCACMGCHEGLRT